MVVRKSMETRFFLELFFFFMLNFFLGFAHLFWLIGVVNHFYHTPFEQVVLVLLNEGVNRAEKVRLNLHRQLHSLLRLDVQVLDHLFVFLDQFF